MSARTFSIPTAAAHSRAQAGMTILELMIAISILTMIGGTLVMLLNRGTQAWRTGESRRSAYDEAQAILRQLRSDLRSLHVTSADARAFEVEGRLACWFDHGRQRLALVRTIPAEARHPLAALAGTQLGAEARLDGREDWKQARAGELRATGGLMEVLYALDPGGAPTLWRATRAPAGGDGTLFDLDALSDPARLEAVAEPFSARVLHLGLRFWTAWTTAWEGEPPGPTAPPGVPLGPTLVWDSTRGLLDPAQDLEEPERWLGRDSLGDPADDIVPAQVLVTLVVAEDPPSGPWSILVEPCAADARELVVESVARLRQRLPWVRVGDEWVRVRDVAGNRLLLERDGRAGRGTVAKAHPVGTEVVTGRTFTAVIELPAVREIVR